MNLSKLFEMQRELDARIEWEHPEEPEEDRLAKKILALLVELGELANELPEIFKFWSNKKNTYERALEEFCDVLHFVLSIGLEIGIDDICNIQAKKDSHVMYMFLDIAELTLKLLDYEIEGYQTYQDFVYMELFEKVLGLGELLGFTWEQIERAYMSKNAENHARQENGY